jgi:hypothetical protein
LGDIELCIDTDALVSLLGLESLGDGLACLGCLHSSCYRLPAAEYQIRRAGWVGDKWPKLDRAACAEIAARLPVAPVPRNLSLQESLNFIDHIHEGEAYLLAHMVESPRSLLVTGDTRMLRALYGARDGAARRVREEIEGRVIIFPQVVGALAKTISVSEVETRWRSAAPANQSHRQKSLTVMFGSAPTRDEEFWLGWESQLQDVTEICSSRLLYPL